MTNPPAPALLALLTAAALTAAACSADQRAPASLRGPSSGVTAQSPTVASTPGPLSPGPATTGDTRSPATPKATGPLSIPDPRTIDQSDATTVSATALTIMWSLDSVQDQNGQRDAFQRAEPYLTPGYAIRLREDTQPQPPPDEWLRHRAYGTVALTRGTQDGAPIDTDTSAYRQWKITTTPTGRDGWHGTTIAVVAYVSLVRPGPDEPWKISLVDTR